MSGPSLSSQPRDLFTFATRFAAGTLSAAAQVQLLRGNAQLLPTVGTVGGLVLIDAEDLALYGKRTMLLYESVAASGSVAPAQTFYLSLFPVTITGVSGADVLSLGAEVPESRGAVQSWPAAGTVGAVVASPTFPVPPTGLYALIATTSAAHTATSLGDLIGKLSALAR